MKPHRAQLLRCGEQVAVGKGRKSRILTVRDVSAEGTKITVTEYRKHLNAHSAPFGVSCFAVRSLRADPGYKARVNG